MQGDGLAIGNLGMLYVRGQGVKTNKVAGMALLLLSVKVDNTSVNNAKKNISATTGLTQQMVIEAQTLSEKMNDIPKMMVPLDGYLKKSETVVNK